MREFTIAAASVALAALFSAAPASAERINGGPLQQNGQCWQGKNHSSPSEATWGYWAPCAQKASSAGRRGGGAAPVRGAAPAEGAAPAQATTTRRRF
jgi:hypothetical protein